MHGVGQSRTHQEGQSGEFEGRDCWGANQALKRRTHQSDEAAQDTLRAGRRQTRRVVAKGQAMARSRDAIISERQ